MTTRTNGLGFNKPADRSKTWGDEIRGNYDVLDHVLCPEYCFYVAKNYSDTNLNTLGVSGKRCFDTIQGAIDHVESLNPSYSTPYTIIVYPGVYDENLVITKSITIQAKFSTMPSFGLGGGSGAYIRGQASVQEPVLHLTPEEGLWVVVNFIGFKFDNAYNGDTSQSGMINKAYLLRVDPQVLTGSRSTRVFFTRCVGRFQTWGIKNEWSAGIWLDGWHDIYLNDCWFKGMNFAGDTDEGGIYDLMLIDGPGAASEKSAKFQVLGGSLESAFTGPTSGPSVIRHIDETIGSLDRTNLALGPNPGEEVQAGSASDTCSGWGSNDARLAALNTRNKWLCML